MAWPCLGLAVNVESQELGEPCFKHKWMKLENSPLTLCTPNSAIQDRILHALLALSK